MKDPTGPRQFATTHWSLVAAAESDEASQQRARKALETLCQIYWFPLYAFVRSRGYSAADAQDLTQSFFAQIIEKGGFKSADRERGRFRSYLLGAMKHFLANEWHRTRTRKRGGHVRFIEWDTLDPEDRYSAASRQWEEPEEFFDREWALSIVAYALDALRQEMSAAGKSERFELLKACLTGEEILLREEVAARLDMTENALKVAVHRLRRRFRQLLEEAIAETVSNELELRNEMGYLLAVLRKG